VATQIEASQQIVAAPMSFAQRRLWLIDRLTPGSSAYNVRHAVRLRGALDVGALQRSIDSVVDRHEILRTRFGLLDDEPVQFIAPSGSAALHFVDMSHLPAEDHESRTREIVAEEAATGFDLENGPLFRALLVRLGAAEHVFLTVMHHIVTDDWSTGVFNRELAAFYDAYSRDGAFELDELPIQYADFAAWQRESLLGDGFERQVGYWRERLAGAPPRIELPTDRPRSPYAGSEGAARSLMVSQTVLERLRELGNQHGATLFMTVLAAFKVLLYRYSGQSDLIVGLPITTRSRLELQSLIGFFVNTLALRTQVSGEQSFRKLLHDVRDGALQAYEHQDAPFEEVIAELHPNRNVGETPLVNVLFHLQNKRGETAPRLRGTEVEPFSLATTTAKFDIIFRAAETSNGLLCAISYRPDIFDGARIDRMLSNFKTLLENIVEAPEQSVRTLPLLTVEQRRRQLVEWNDTATDYLSERTLADGFEAQAERTPDAVAVADGASKIAYRELDRRANQVAHHLQSLGIGSGEVVGICIERSLETVLATLATLKAGAVYLPLDPEYPHERLEYMLRDAGARVVLTRDRFASRLEGVGAAVCRLDSDAARIAQHPGDRLPRTTTCDDLAYVMYTSGSTGRPKGVCVPHRAVNRLVTNTNYVAIAPSDVMGAVSNVAFDAATFELWGALLHGARIEIIPRETVLSPKHFAEILRERRVTVMFLTAALLRHVAAQEPAAFAGLHCLIAGGDALDPSAVAAVLAHGPPTTFLNGYGPTEATTFACTYEIESADPRGIPIGRPVANTQAYVLDRDLQPAPVGVDGQLYIGGPGLARGYLNDSELTSRKFVTQPLGVEGPARLYATGDLTRYRADGTIEFVGRVDNQVKIRGFRIETGEIEVALRRHAGVRDAAVIVRQDAAGDKALVAYVVAEQTASPSAEDVRRALSERLPVYMIPSIVLVAELPLTLTGKLDVEALQILLEPSQTPETTPYNPLHHLLITIWEDILGITSIGIRENFFELGGHSLLATRLIAEVSRSFGKQVPLTEFFIDPTIEHMARILVEGLDKDASSPLVAVQPLGSRTPFFFLHGDLVGGGYYVRKMARRLNADQPFYALHVHGTNGRRFPDTIEAMATDYITVIKEVQPEGPYILGGFCSGALVAFEMALQLQARKEPVSKLILLDAPGGNARLSAAAGLLNRLLTVVGVNARRRLAIRSILGRAASRWRWTQRHGRLMAAGAPKLAQLRNRFAGKTPRAVVLRGPEVFEQTWRRITASYIPRRYRGGMTVILARPGGALGIDEDKRIGWRHVCDQVDLRAVPGAHLTCITSHVDETAMRLNECLGAPSPADSTRLTR